MMKILIVERGSSVVLESPLTLRPDHDSVIGNITVDLEMDNQMDREAMLPDYYSRMATLEHRLDRVVSRLAKYSEKGYRGNRRHRPIKKRKTKGKKK